MSKNWRSFYAVLILLVCCGFAQSEINDYRGNIGKVESEINKIVDSDSQIAITALPDLKRGEKIAQWRLINNLGKGIMGDLE